MTANDATWLPNLVGGTSIWKLAVDLNEPKFFDGRLLVPETEGSESLPVTVRWDLTGLVPLAEAQATYPAETAAAVTDFQAALERVAVVFKTPNSGFDRYKDAFTVPSLEGESGANYFYSPEKKKLLVINWGASPRSMGGKAEYVFGYEQWAQKWKDEGASPAGVAAPAITGAAAAAIATGVAAAVTAEAKAEEQKKEDEKKKTEKKRPWWIWPLFVVVVIGGILLVLFLLKSCDEPKGPASVDASPDAIAATSEAGADAAGAADAAADAMAIADAATDASAAGDAGDAGALADAGKDGGGKDGGKDGGLAATDDDDDGAGGVIVGGGASSGGAGGTVTVKIGPGGGSKTGAHRKHYMDQAQAWRVSAGNGKVSRTEQSGHRFDVWLSPNQSFEGVRVEWQDGAGKWHVH